MVPTRGVSPIVIQAVALSAKGFYLITREIVLSKTYQAGCGYSLALGSALATKEDAEARLANNGTKRGNRMVMKGLEGRIVEGKIDGRRPNVRKLLEYVSKV